MTDCPVCGHDAEDHAGGHGDDRLDPCQVDGCDCQGPFADDPYAAQINPVFAHHFKPWSEIKQLRRTRMDTQELANEKIIAETELIKAQTRVLLAQASPSQADQASEIQQLKDCLQDALRAETLAHPAEGLAPWTRKARELLFGGPSGGVAAIAYQEGRGSLIDHHQTASPHYCCVCDMPAVAAELGQWYCNAHRSGA